MFRLRRFVKICGSQNRGGMGFGGPFLKTLSICLGVRGQISGVRYNSGKEKWGLAGANSDI